MGDKTGIEWTDKTWNPVTGCTKISPGCAHCYAERMARRLAGRCGYPPVPDEFRVTLHPDKLDEPLHWKRPSMIFVDSMGDLFHRDVAFEYITTMFDIMARANWHTFQILTKRADIMLRFFKWYGKDGVTSYSLPLPNVWLGVSAENQATADERIPLLLQTPAAMRFASVEPMLGRIDLTRFLSLGVKNEYRRNCIQGSFGQGVADNPEWRDLADCMPTMGPVGGRNKSSSMQTAQGREGIGGGVFPSESDVEQQKIQCPCPSPDLLPLFRSHPAGIDYQSQERAEVGQPSRESGIDDILRASNSLPQGLETGKIRPTRTEECNDEINSQPGYPNSSAAGTRREAKFNCDGFQGFLSDSLKDSETGYVGLSWIICGCESGPKARPTEWDWARDLRDQCLAAGVPFFLKQLVVGGRLVKLPELDGRVWDQIPEEQ